MMGRKLLLLLSPTMAGCQPGIHPLSVLLGNCCCFCTQLCQPHSQSTPHTYYNGVAQNTCSRARLTSEHKWSRTSLCTAAFHAMYTSTTRHGYRQGVCHAQNGSHVHTWTLLHAPATHQHHPNRNTCCWRSHTMRPTKQLARRLCRHNLNCSLTTQTSTLRLDTPSAAIPARMQVHSLKKPLLPALHRREHAGTHPRPSGARPAPPPTQRTHTACSFLLPCLQFFTAACRHTALTPSCQA
jgi:hypothetical protein